MEMMQSNGRPKGLEQALPADNTDNGLFGQDILSVRQFNRDLLQYVCDVADEMRSMVARFGKVNLLDGKILGNLFYEPSTRTSSSFQAAMLRLGGRVIPINEVTYSSVTKGESLPDTVRTLECYCDVIVLRHPQVGAAATAAHYARKPIINAGDGHGEHPTQALLDFLTIRRELGQLDGLKVAMVGDLKYGRTVHSLTRLMCMYDTDFYFVSPENLRLPEELIDEVTAHNLPYHELIDVNDVIAKADVLYVTRVQGERFEDQSEYEAVKDFYVIDPDLLSHAKEKMVVMHPMPRVHEVSYQVDDDPRAAYFRQMENGLHMRMAVLAAVLGKA